MKRINDEIKMRSYVQNHWWKSFECFFYTFSVLVFILIGFGNLIIIKIKLLNEVFQMIWIKSHAFSILMAIALFATLSNFRKRKHLIYFFTKKFRGFTILVWRHEQAYIFIAYSEFYGMHCRCFLIFSKTKW